MKQYRLVLFLTIMWLLLGACMDGDVRDTQSTLVQPTNTTELMMVTPSHSPTLTPSVVRTTETPTPAPTKTPVLPTPVLPDWILRNFLFGNQKSGCELPCWQNLIPGESSAGETQSILHTVFEFGEVGSFVVDRSQATAVMTPHRGLYRSSYGWYLNIDPQEGFGVDVWIEDETSILQGIEFSWGFQSLSTIDTNMSPQRIVTELGPPSYILISVAGLEVSDQGYVRLLMIYKRGIVFSYDVIVRITFQQNKPNNPIMELCLSSERWAKGHSPVASGSVDLMSQLSHGLDNLSPVQTRFIGNRIDTYGLMPVQDILGLSVNEFADTALKGGDACIFADITGKLQ